MFEDLKQQWKQYEGQGFDYVLLDSRTGHTDVGGICTRQLPDAVVIMFVPNEQNIDGLAPIVAGIRAEERSTKIQLHFCPSNVPDLDDEKGILSGLLSKASAKLNYDAEEALTIHHYNSLDILAQPAFVISRPNSKLAKEYEALRKAIVAGNLDDEEGAAVALGRMSREIGRTRRLRKEISPKELLTNVINIRAKHTNSGEIAYLAARVFNKVGDQAEELEALTAAINLRHDVNRSLLARAALYLILDRRDEAIADLRQVLVSPTASVFELGLALQRLRTIDNRWLDAVERALDRPDSEFRTLRGIIAYLASYREALPALAKRMESSISSNELDDTSRRSARNRAVLSYIGAGGFEKAMKLISPAGTPPTASAPLDDLFNYAVADWGAHGVAPQGLFQFVADRFAAEGGQPDANLHQCFALAFAVLGHAEQARKELNVARAALSPGSTEFSCWRYLYVSRDEMEEDLQAMEARLDAGRPLEPSFFGDVRSSGR
jgi:tetratricopeptide (TPR) repeat protein